jgi:hypothetical protein
VAEVWVVMMTAEDKPVVVALADRRRKLGLDSSYAATIRASVKLAASASDDDLMRGEL